MSETLIGTPSRRRTSPRGPVERVPASGGLAQRTIADLSAADIRGMTDGELAETIRAADVPLLRETTIGRLQFFDRDTLEQLAFLARRSCRNADTFCQSGRREVGS